MISSEQIIYLDNNATTQLDPAVIEEMLPFLTKYFGNPSSGYRFGAQVRSAVDLARERVAADRPDGPAHCSRGSRHGDQHHVFLPDRTADVRADLGIDAAAPARSVDPS